MLLKLKGDQKTNLEKRKFILKLKRMYRKWLPFRKDLHEQLINHYFTRRLRYYITKKSIVQTNHALPEIKHLLAK